MSHVVMPVLCCAVLQATADMMVHLIQQAAVSLVTRPWGKADRILMSRHLPEAMYTSACCEQCDHAAAALPCLASVI